MNNGQLLLSGSIDNSLNKKQKNDTKIGGKKTEVEKKEEKQDLYMIFNKSMTACKYKN